MPETKLNSKLPLIKKSGEESNTRLYFLLGLLGILIVVGAGVLVWLNTSEVEAYLAPEVDLPPEGLEENVSQLLPQVTRTDDSVGDDSEPSLWAEKDPFALPMELQGVVLGGSKDLAIIQASQTTYIVSHGETLAGSWEVVEINRDSVRLKNDGEEIVIKLGVRE